MDERSDTTLLIRDGLLVTPEAVLEADVFVRGERIEALGRGLPAAQDTVVLSAADRYVFPGVIDAHTHIALDTGVYRTADDWFTATCAAACGGVTTVIDFATQFPGQSLRQAVAARLEEARDTAIDFGLHVMITDLPPDREPELGDLLDLGAPSVKLYTTYRPHYYADDATILRLLMACAERDILPLVHCENDALVTAHTAALVAAGRIGWQHHGRSRPALAEEEAVQRVLFLANAIGCPVHIVHCSTTGAVMRVAKAREEGQVATCETCPQYLVLDDSAYESPEPWRYILQPPLRGPTERPRLWAQVVAGAVDLIATDHCDYSVAQKTATDDFTRTPGGLPGLETLLPLMFTLAVDGGRLALPRLAALLSANPARIWGLWPRKGALLPGFDADIVIYDPEPQGVIRTAHLHHAAGYTPYEGLPVQGRVQATILRGQVVYQEGRFRGQRGQGRFVRRYVRNTSGN